MEYFTPADIPLPEFLDPFLNYLSTALPPPLNSIVLNLLSHGLALLTALVSLVYTLASTHLWEWNIQSVLPPLIALFAAYFALLSAFRTLTWTFRVGFWFAKWATIIGGLAAAIGWLMGVNGGGGMMAGFGGLALDAINGRGQNAAGGARTARSPRNRPKPWESFQQHREWQYQEQQGQQGGEDVQKIIGDVLGAAGRAVKESSWWEAAKGVVDSAGEKADANKDGRSKGRTRSKVGKTKGTR